MECAVETVLPREVRKLASTIEGKDAVIVLMNDDLQGRDDEIQAIKYENVGLQAQKDVCQAELQNVRIPSHILKHVMFLMRKIQARTTLSSLYGNIQRLPKTNLMTCHIISREYNGMLN